MKGSYLITIVAFSALLVPISVIAQPDDPLVDSLVRKLPSMKNDSNKVKTYMDIGNNISYYDSRKALDFARQGFALSQQINYATGLARTTYLMGNVFLDLGLYDSSRIKLDEAEKLFQSLGRTDMIGMINNARGNWHYMQSDMWNASHYYTRAAEIFHQLNDTIREFIPYQNLIASLGEIKNYEKAISLSKKLLEVLKAQNDSLQMAHTLNHLIINYTALGKMEEARIFIPDLLSFIDNTIDYNLASDSYNVIGEYYFKNNKTDSAIYYYQLALEKALRNNYQPSLYYNSLGAAYLKKGDLPKAYEYLSKAQQLAANANSRDIYYRICLHLADYYKARGDYRNAELYLREHQKLNDSFLVAETRQYSTQLEAVYENNKKENEILKLRTTELENSIAIKKRTNFFYAAAGLALLLAVYLVLQIRNAKNKRLLQEEKINNLEKQQQVISLQSMINGQESERSRIAKDLHDGLGGLFSTIKMYFSSLQHERPELTNDELFAKSYELTDTASVELRRIAHNLMPEVLLKLGLLNAVQDLCNNINMGRLLKVSLQSYGMEKRLTGNTEVMLYRIIQELLNNIIKHSQATEVLIQFNKHSDRLTITIEDNGRGFNVEEAAASGNAGIGTIKSRVNYLNGQLNIDSKQGIGTTVIMEFLMQEED